MSDNSPYISDPLMDDHLYEAITEAIAAVGNASRTAAMMKRVLGPSEGSP
jgi:hypothetical protein